MVEQDGLIALNMPCCDLLCGPGGSLSKPMVERDLLKRRAVIGCVS